MNLKDKSLTEEDYKKYILEHYTFLSRPVFVINKFTLAEPNKTCLKSAFTMSRRNVALFGATIVSVIYGITFTIERM
jgi:hypothetical protein